MSDNGLEFSNRIYRSKKGKPAKKIHLFSGKCSEYNIEQRFTKICSPQTNGMAERVIRTIKEKTIYKNNYGSVDELAAGIADFTVFYNLERKHYGIVKELGLRTPFDAILFWFEKKPELFHCEPNFFKEKMLNCGKITKT